MNLLDNYFFVDILVAMKLKDRVLQILKEEDKAVSGNALANRCAVSRNAIWLAIEELRKDGYKIESKKNVGYKLQVDFAPILEEEIWQSLDKLVQDRSSIKKIGQQQEKDFTFILLESVDSTNTYCKQHASQLADWTVVLAEEQTAGRGRQNRVFHSPKYAGVYMSILLRPQIELQLLPRITACAAVAVCKAIEKLTEQKPQIKWVNDVFLQEKKVVGILTESTMQIEQGGIDFVVVGIGVNFYAKSIAENLQEIATALFDDSNFKAEYRPQFVAYFLDFFRKALGGLKENSFFTEYKGRLFILGRKVRVLLQNTSFLATVKDINENYNLLVELESGEQKTLTAGEVSLKLDV